MKSLLARFKALWTEWPAAPAHKVASFFAKLVIVANFLALLVLAGIMLAGMLPIAIAMALLFTIVLLLVNLFVRWFGDKQPPIVPKPMPKTPNERCDLEQLLGPFNSQEGFRLYDAVFEGGGAKAIAQIGAMARLHELGLRPRKIIATSGGAIVGAFLLAGATPEQIWQSLSSVDLTRLLDPRWLPNQRWLRRSLFGVVTLIPGLVFWKGAVRGDAFERLMREELLKVCGGSDLSFRRFAETEQKRRHPVELQMIATDVTLRRALDLPKDIADYDRWQTEEEGGQDAADLSVVKAVRMSMSIPFVFEPVRLVEREHEVDVDICDGGISSNYPIRYFDTRDAQGPRFPTFGFLLDERLSHSNSEPSSIHWLPDFVSHVIQSGVGAIDRILTPHDEARTIFIPTLGVGAVDFDLTPEKQENLFWAGYYAASDMLQSFSWRDYIKTYRGCRASIPEGCAGEPGEIDGVTYSARQPAAV